MDTKVNSKEKNENELKGTKTQSNTATFLPSNIFIKQALLTKHLFNSKLSSNVSSKDNFDSIKDSFLKRLLRNIYVDLKNNFNIQVQNSKEIKQLFIFLINKENINQLV